MFSFDLKSGKIMVMIKKSLKNANIHLRKPATARKMRVRSIASSTAIETGESIAKIEAKLKTNRRSKHRVKLG
ncbi:MAG: hypothetical protein DWP95_09670 [Proteobacteria bacterium]|nr:MAG: hypothetical protein DWP95_09670 [Pseudomonadota bacterium]